MKFVCLACETYMTLEKVEKPEEGSLGVFFVCPSCNARFSMVTNAGETNMMNVLGLKLGARAESADPTLASLADKIQKAKAVGTAGVSSEAKTTSGCPFSAMVAEMGLAGSGKSANGGASEFTWTPDAKEKLDRLPSFVRPMVQSSVEAYARKQGIKIITLQVMDDSKHDSPSDLVWSREAEQRLENIPDFIRPMARREIERVARERGLQTVTAQVMDEAKEKFLKFM
ncbi:MAG: PCP reductase family protein [Nitrospira sp.]|nr:PCP reductase family protein [Nitrospira sp.]